MTLYIWRGTADISPRKCNLTTIYDLPLQCNTLKLSTIDIMILPGHTFSITLPFDI